VPKRRAKNVSVQNSENLDYSGTQELVDSENGLIGYSTEIVRKLIKFTSATKMEIGQVLEFGAGTGFLADIWKFETGKAPDCVEIDPNLVAQIRSRGFVCFSSIDECHKEYDVIYTSNVLEHIEDDIEALRILGQHMKSGARIGIYVPALPILFSDMDRSVGHFRRYKRKELMAKVTKAGFTIERCSYDDFIGFFASMTIKILGYKSTGNLGSVKSLQMYDRIIYPISRVFDLSGTRKIIGKNLILVAVKP
jgi:SAM-dependent methyltransferase